MKTIEQIKSRIEVLDKRIENCREQIRISEEKGDKFSASCSADNFAVQTAARSSLIWVLGDDND